MKLRLLVKASQLALFAREPGLAAQRPGKPRGGSARAGGQMPLFTGESWGGTTTHGQQVTVRAHRRRGSRGQAVQVQRHVRATVLGQPGAAWTPPWHDEAFGRLYPHDNTSVEVVDLRQRLHQEAAMLTPEQHRQALAVYDTHGRRLHSTATGGPLDLDSRRMEWAAYLHRTHNRLGGEGLHEAALHGQPLGTGKTLVVRLAGSSTDEGPAHVRWYGGMTREHQDWTADDHRAAFGKLQQYKRDARVWDSDLINETIDFHEWEARRKDREARLKAAWSEDPGGSGLLLHEGLDQEKHAAALQECREEFARIPETIQAALRRAGIQGQIVERFTDAHPELRGKKPRGWRAGSTWDDLRGGAGDTHFTFAPGGDKGDSRGSVFLHELGHAADRLVASGPKGKRLSALPWFDRWYAAARKRERFGRSRVGGLAIDSLDDAGPRRIIRATRTGSGAEAQSQIDVVLGRAFPRWGYFADYLHQPGQAGRQEFLAEVFAVYYSGEAGRKLCETEWPGLMQSVHDEIHGAASHIAARGAQRRVSNEVEPEQALAKAAATVIGAATVLDDGALLLELRAEASGLEGDAVETTTPDAAVLAGWVFEEDPRGLRPGESTWILAE